MRMEMLVNHNLEMWKSRVAAQYSAYPVFCTWPENMAYAQNIWTAPC